MAFVLFIDWIVFCFSKMYVDFCIANTLKFFHMRRENIEKSLDRSVKSVEQISVEKTERLKKANLS